MMTAAVTRALAELVVGFSAAELPASAEHAGRRTFVNVVGLAVGAAHHPAVELALRAVETLGTPADASVLGRAERLGVTHAPLLNGIAMHVEDFDDTHLRTVIHPGAPVVPAALAAAEWTNASGEDVLLATILGVEVALRVGNAMGPGHFDRGWHLTSTMGHLGAAAAGGRLIGLDVDQMIVALGIAATEAAGLTEALGTMTKSFHPGKAASDGVEAALLAAEGYTGPAAPLEGRRGLLAVAAPEPEAALALEGIGERWEIELNAFKPYACGIVSHPVIDAGQAFRDLVTDAREIDTVEARINPVVLDVMGVEDPQDGLQSKFSVYHCFAVGFLHGAGGPAQFSDATARDPDVVALRRKVRTITDPTTAKDAASVRVRTVAGDDHVHRVEHATGSASSPMSDAQLRDKFLLVTRPVLGADADRLHDVASSIGSLPDVAPVFAASLPDGRGDGDA